MQYPGLPPLPNLEVCRTLQLANKSIFRACRGKIAATFRTLEIFDFLGYLRYISTSEKYLLIRSYVVQ